MNQLFVKGIISEFIGIISSGKESNVYLAYNQDEEPVLIKIYKIDSQNTKWMKNYIIGDPRFKKIGTSTNKIIYTWCRKEFKNLSQMYRKQIRVPRPIYAIDNVLVMEFLGTHEGTPAPRLKDVGEIPDPKGMLDQILLGIKRMYLDAHLVHADLSEFNILFYNSEPYFIDVSQAVSIFHLNSPLYLERDVKNILTFFERYLDTNEMPPINEFVGEILASQENQDAK